MKARKVPCIVVLEGADENGYWSFEEVMAHEKSKKIYFGDKMDPNVLFDEKDGKIKPTSDISLCEGCYCMTHTLEDGTCGKCGAKKEEDEIIRK